MDVLKAQLERIKSQLAGLSATQRMLVATLVALMGITLYYCSHYAGTPEMVPVLDQSLNGEDAVAVERVLRDDNIPYQRSGDQILVSADHKMDAVADIAYSQAMPQHSSQTFQEIMKDLTPFSPQSDRDAHMTQYKQAALSSLMRRWPGVADVSVLINDADEYRVENPVMPSASVAISTRDGAAGGQSFHKLVAAAAAFTAGAVQDLAPRRVTVTIDGRLGHGEDNAADASSSDLVDTEQNYAQKQEQTIRELFNNMPGLDVVVRCDVNDRNITEHSTAFDPKASMVKAQTEEDKEQSTTNGSPAGGEPGVGANTSASIPEPGGAGPAVLTSQTTESDTKTTNAVFAAETEKSVTEAAGKPSAESAALRVPRSYFVGICKKGDPNAPEPSENALATVVETEIANIREQVVDALHIPADAVSVKMYTEIPPMMAMAAAPGAVLASNASSAASLPAVGALANHVKEIGVLALAVVSLFMMSSMVRKATPAPVVIPAPPEEDEEEEPTILTTAEALAGEAGAGNPLLDGMELDEDAVRAQQMLQQVTTMVKENPDSAAVLVKRWLNRS